MSSYEYYRIFYQVARSKSITKAAEILRSNQPNVTRCMNQLEYELGCKLLVRSNRGISLTPEGEKFYRRVAIACEQLALGEEELREDQSLEKGTVTIGVTETSLRLYLLQHLEEFQRSYPGVRLRIANHSTGGAVRALNQQLVDFIVITTPVDLPKKLRAVELMKFREIPITGERFREYTERKRSLEELHGIPFISLRKGTSTRELYASLFMSKGLEFRPDLEAATTDQVLQMAMHNLGFGFVPEQMATGPLERGEILALPYQDELPQRSIILVWDRERHNRIAVQKLVDVLAAAKEK